MFSHYINGKVKKFLIKILCGFIPSKRIRSRIRNRIPSIHPQFLSNRNGKLCSHNDFEDNYVAGDWHAPAPLVCVSQLCNQEFFNLPLYQYWVKMIKEPPRMHRKQWEFVYIAQALYENGMLASGKKGLGFGCGIEPLPALFASMGCEIVATDLDINDPNSTGWAKSNENTMNKVENLNTRGIVQADKFKKLVQFMPLNMNEIPKDLHGKFDFNWSACVVEHIGGMDKSMAFLIENLKTLKNGGIAIHTLEFNLSSDVDTCFDPKCFIFRRRDVERVGNELRKLGHEVFPMNFKIGTYLADNYIDTPPYYGNKIHLRLQLGQFVSTSFGLIVRKH
jgi:SAM-dependent methyltransferase